MLGKALGTENGEHGYLIMGKTKFHWEQHALGKHWKGHISFGNMIWKANGEDPFHWEQHASYGKHWEQKKWGI